MKRKYFSFIFITFCFVSTKEDNTKLEKIELERFKDVKVIQNPVQMDVEEYSNLK